MGRNYYRTARIMRRLVEMVTAGPGGHMWSTSYPGVIARLKELGITPDRPDEEIETRLRELVDSGELLRNLDDN